MNKTWLQAYLVGTIRRNLCTRIYCTTCGAREFRNGLLHAVSDATGAAQLRLDRVAAAEIASALAEFSPQDLPRHTAEEAVRCILFDLWSQVPMSVKELHSRLGQTWSGQVLRRMEEHYSAQVARRAQAFYEDPLDVQRRRDEKRRLRSERHQERLVKQRERSRLWQDRHRDGS